MKTKRILGGLAALTLAGLMSMTAFADTTVNPKGGTPFDVTPNPETANTQVEFSIDPAYTVTIPQKVELEKNEELGKYTGSGEIKAESVFLEPNDRIEVTLTSGSGFKLSHEKDSTITLPYIATGFYGNVDAENNGRVVATFATSTEEQKLDVVFSTTEEPEYAGKYSDTVVFGISVKTETNN